MPTPPKSLPRYRELYELLREGIIAGTYGPGSLLPSEHQLCEKHGVTRPTVRQGLEELVRDGYIKKVRGKGSIVQAPKQVKGIGILNIKGTTDSLPSGKLRTKVVDAPTVGCWPAELEFPLSETVFAAGCTSLSRLRLLDNQPIFYEETHLPSTVVPDLNTHDFNDASLFNVLQSFYNIRVIGGNQHIRAVTPAQKICQLLSVATGTPILRLDKRYETNLPDVYFYTSIWCHTDDYYLEGAL